MANMCGIYPLNPQPADSPCHTTGWFSRRAKMSTSWKRGLGHVHHPQHKCRDLLNHPSPLSSFSVPGLACSAEPVPRRGWSLAPKVLQGFRIQEVALLSLASPSSALQQLSLALASSSGIPVPSMPLGQGSTKLLQKNKFHPIASLRHRDNHLEMIKHLLVFEMRFGAQRDPCTA